MQGRLSQKKGSPLQSFPNKTWEDEFIRAKNIGFKNIEWLLDDEDKSKNPLFSIVGRDKIKKLIKENSIKVETLCAHFLINGSVLKDSSIGNKAINLFSETLLVAPLIGIKYISVPFLGKMSLKNKSVRNKFFDIFKNIDNKHNIQILIESDLNNYDLVNFLSSIGDKNIGILYDTGNATKNNFSFKEQFTLISEKIREIHIKDYCFNSKKSVRLGKGSTDFNEIFKTIKECNWIGPIILETPIEEDWYQEALSNFKFISNNISI